MPDQDQPSRRRGFIRNPRDFVGGLGLVLVAAAAFWASRDLSGMQGSSFGSGTAPRLFAGGLAACGALVAAVALLADGPSAPRYHFRGPLFVTASVILFALTVRPFGLVIASFSTILLASIGTSEIRWVEAVIWAAGLTLFCALLFPIALNLPLPLWPR